ncbi:ABC transporter substrate-binding protein [Paenibacillus sp. GCM10027626]|uniref:ABC transporter substrate-binding protein n=1 Tax=Paenibacillus sp. GCM10027626 TaxID=3273411 RepID=UPI003627E0F5
MTNQVWQRFLAISAVVCLLFLAACSSGGGNNDAGTGAKSEAGQNKTGENGSGQPEQKEPAAAEKVDPFGKYEPEIVVETVKATETNVKFAPGQSWDSNIWFDLIKRTLGIQIKNIWLAPAEGQQFEQKMNVTIASGDLPDFFEVSGSQLQQLAEDGQIADLTAVYDNYGSPLLKDLLDFDKGISLSAATIGGKLMAIPKPFGYSDTQGFIWIRNDWLQKYGLTPPEKLDDVWQIAQTFVDKQAGGAGTIGLPLRKDLEGDLGGVDQMFNSYHAYPRMWVKGQDGKLVYGSIQPEMKEALGKLQELYKSGIIDQEFGVKDYGKVCESALASGKAGIYFGGMADPLGCTSSGFQKEQADWVPYKLVSNDGKPVLSQAKIAPPSYYVVSKDAKHPEALIKILNLFGDVGFGERSKETHQDYNPLYFSQVGDTPSANFHVMPFVVFLQNKNVLDHKDYMEYLKDPAGYAFQETSDKQLFENMDAYLKWKETPGQPVDQTIATSWAYYMIFGPVSTQAVIDEAMQNNRYIFDEYLGPPTETMKQKQALLSKAEKDMMTRIVMGSASIDEFDKFVDQWRKLGGDKITEEVNAWYEARK